MKLIFILTLCLILTGCASFGKGVTEAFLEKQDEDDLRICEVRGKSFDGIEAALSGQSGKTKVLMVHGVGDHAPGYSTQFMEMLGHEMGLPVMERKYKAFDLTDPSDTSKQLGTLRVHRLMNESETKQLLFYELTWSAITEPQKAVLAYDNSGEYSFRRAAVNDMLKKFSNDTGPDPMIYLGESHNDILTSFRQSLCWMVTRDWNGLPSESDQPCALLTEEALTHMEENDFAIVSHSLGSRITMDGMQQIAGRFAEKTAHSRASSLDSRFNLAFKKKQIPLFMLSNQLPLLQLGRKLPEVTGQKEAYCTPGGNRYNDRIVSETALIAFSDPNDILSYAIPYGFADNYLDSRLCIDVTNININVAQEFELFGLGKVANPLTAHIGYDTDPRVVALIAKGIGNPRTSPLVKERCQWTRLVD